MKRSFLVPALALLFAGQVARAQPPAALAPPQPALPAPAAVPPPPPPGPDGHGPCDSMVFDGPADNERLWFSAEALAWYLRGMRVPSLVTTSPAGTARDQAGVLNADGTTILFGNDRINADAHFGGRFGLGYMNADASWPVGFEGNFFSLATTATHFASPDGDTIVGRPFFDPSAGRQDALLVNFPGAISGTTQINTTQFLLGAEALVRENFYLSPGLRIDGLAGYRFLNLREQLHITDNFTSTDPASTVAVGTNVNVNDNFETTNYFHGAEVGVAAVWGSGPLSLETVLKLAVGGDNHRLVINGFTTTTTPGATAVVTPGGLLAQPGNSGRTNGTDWTLVPEGALNLRWDVNSNIRLTAGYTFLWWDSVVRPGDQIDTVVNRTGLSGGTQTGENRPILITTTSGMWVQGIQVGLTFSF
jgi:hypothetical protein